MAETEKQNQKPDPERGRPEGPAPPDRPPHPPHPPHPDPPDIDRGRRFG
jgi:hypothetical protein